MTTMRNSHAAALRVALGVALLGAASVYGLMRCPPQAHAQVSRGNTPVLGPNFRVTHFVATTTPQIACPARLGRTAMSVQQIGTTTVYLGGAASQATSTSGIAVPGSPVIVNVPTGGDIWAAASTGTDEIACIEAY